MPEQAVLGILAGLALLVAAYVETHGGDPAPYVTVGTTGLAYIAGHKVATIRKSKR